MLTVAIIILLVFLFIVLIFNSTAFLHKESSDYSGTQGSPVMDERVKPIFSVHGNRRAVLYIHGFPSTPATYEYVAHLSELNGYDVFAPLLPGCGTTPKDLTSKNFTQWYAFVRDLYLRYRKDYDYFYLAGSSMGGALSLKLAEEFSGTSLSPSAIFVASTPVFLNSIHNFAMRSPLLYLIRMVGWFFDYIPAKRRFKELEDGEERWIGYSGLFPRQIYSLMIALRPIRRNLRKITVPVYAVHSKGDRTASFKNLKFIMNHVSSELRKQKIYDLRKFNHSRHTLFLYDSTRDDIWSELSSFFREVESSGAREGRSISPAH
jgi:carboxylesterase